MENLKDLQVATKSRDKKVTILKPIPTEWSIPYTAEFFDVPHSLIEKAHDFRLRKSLLNTPEQKGGNQKLSAEIIKTIKDFYISSDHTRTLPGKNNFKSINHEHIQKKLILLTLRELYVLFKEENLDLKVGFSKFCSMRPQQCVLAGSSGTHSVCVCIKRTRIIICYFLPLIKKLDARI